MIFTDVDTTGFADGNVLMYSAGASGWVPGTAASSDTLAGLAGGGGSSCSPSIGNFASQETNGGASTYSLTGYTVSSSANNQMLVVMTAAENINSQSPTGATFDGTPMTALTPATGNSAKAGIFYLPSPAVTTGNIVVTYSGAGSSRAAVAAMVLDCVDTAATPQSTTSNITSTSISDNLTPSDDNTIIVDVLANENAGTPSETGDAGTTHIAQSIASGGSSWGVSSLVQLMAANATFSWSMPSGQGAHAMATFAPQAPVSGSCSDGDAVIMTSTGWGCGTASGGASALDDLTDVIEAVSLTAMS